MFFQVDVTKPETTIRPVAIVRPQVVVACPMTASVMEALMYDMLSLVRKYMYDEKTSEFGTQKNPQSVT